MENKGERNNKGKARWSLVDFKSMEPMVRVLEFGAKKYEDDNWSKGLGVKGICESLLRHTFALLSGETNDPESGLPHVGHIQCNAMFLSHMMQFKPEFDDRRGEEFYKSTEEKRGPWPAETANEMIVAKGPFEGKPIFLDLSALKRFDPKAHDRVQELLKELNILQ